MAYTPIHAWKRKDKLPSKDPQKIIYGEQLQDEFDAISVGIDGLNDQVEDIKIEIDGLGGNSGGGGTGGDYDDTQIKADLATETNARIAGDADLQTQIDNLPSGGGGASTWDELTGKPAEFPPEAHTQGWDTITDRPAEFPPEAHGHEEIAKDAAYIKYEGDTWKASPSMEVDGNLSVSGDSTLTGGLEVSGNIDASGSISVDGDLAITGKIEGDLTVNGNITIDGGQIVDPDGNPSGGLSTHVGPDAPDPAVEGQMWFNTNNGVLYVYYDNNGSPEWVAAGSASDGGTSTPSTHVGDTAPIDPVEGQMWLNSDDGYLYAYYENAGNPTWMAVEREA